MDFKLQSVQNQDYIDVKRYYLLYQIFTNTSGMSYKRAVVDYTKNKDSQIILVDWSPVTYASDFSLIEKISVDNQSIGSVIKLYPSLYSDENTASYTIDRHKVSKVEEYKIVYVDATNEKASLRVVYLYQGHLITLVDSSTPLHTFKPYKHLYQAE